MHMNYTDPFNWAFSENFVSFLSYLENNKMLLSDVLMKVNEEKLYYLSLFLDLGMNFLWILIVI